MGFYPSRAEVAESEGTMSTDEQLDQRVALLWSIEKLIYANLAMHEKHLCLSSGLAGIALFYSALFRFAPSRPVEEKLDEIISLIHKEISRADFLDDGLFMGIPGVGLALELIAQERGFPMDKVAELNDDVDSLILEGLSSGPTLVHFDLVSGLAGLGLYALSRNKPSAREQIFSAVYAKLMAGSTLTESGRKWRTDPPFAVANKAELYPDGYDDLGIAHGNAGVVTVLAKAVCATTNIAGLRNELRSAANWLLAQRRDNDAIFGQVAGDCSHARNAWCVGDAGISLALFHSGRALGDAKLIQAGRVIGAQSAHRSRESSRVEDHGLCHGTMGLSLIYMHFFALTGDPVFAHAAQSWETSMMASVATHSLKALATHRGPVEPPAMSLGVVNGVAGIGLSLIDNITGKTGRWSSFLGV